MFERSLDRAHLVAVGVALVLLFSIAFLSFAGWQEYVQSADQTRRTLAVIQSSRGLTLDLEHAEIAVQRFILTGDAAMPAKFTRIRDRIHNSELALNQLITGDSRLPGPSAALQNAIELSLVALSRQLRRPDSFLPLQTRALEALTGRVVILEGAFETGQRSKLGVERVRTRYFAHLSQLTATFGCLCVFLIVLFSSIRIQNLIRLRARLNQHLADLAAELRHVTDSVPQLVWRMSNACDVEYLNQRWAEFSDPYILETRAWVELLHPLDRDKFLADLQRGCDIGIAFAAECRLQNRASGRFQWFLFRASPGIPRDVADLKWYGTFTDIHQLKKMEFALQRANSDLEQFSYAAAHDLQEPLRNVANCLSLLRHNSASHFDEETRRWIDEGVQGTNRMRSMVKDLLTCAKAVGTGPVNHSLANANDVLGDVLANLSGVIQQTGARFVVDSLPTLPVQPLHLLQIFQNLIANSLKYRIEGLAPVIAVSARCHEDEWIFSVRDNGIGFDPKYARRIFGMFKRLHGKDEYAGTGVGLAICARVVSHYGGQIWAESLPGKGAAFHFALPVYEEQASSLRQSNNAAESELEFSFPPESDGRAGYSPLT